MKRRHLTRSEQIQAVGMFERVETQRAVAEAFNTSVSFIN